jgi:hypothetical protein
MTIARFVTVAILLHLSTVALLAEPAKYALPLPADMERADLYAEKTVPSPVAVLVLCPGCNENGAKLLARPEWISFAKERRLGLVAISFASPMQTITDGKGYYIASAGSGQALLDGVRKIYGRDLPILIYGFSGGAHFTSSMEEWNPERVVAWCCYSAGWWQRPVSAENSPPGIVACGTKDDRFQASLRYYLQGRALEKRWTWVALPNTGHTANPALDQFVRRYFATILEQEAKTDAPQTKSVWYDIDSLQSVDANTSRGSRQAAAWLPTAKLGEEWAALQRQQ